MNPDRNTQARLEILEMGKAEFTTRNFHDADEFLRELDEKVSPSEQSKN